MKAQKLIFLSLAACLLLVSCGNNNALYEARLDGFDNGKRTMKLSYELTKATDENGAAMKIDYLFQFSQGTKVRRSKKRVSFVDKDYHLIATSADEVRGLSETKWSTKIVDGHLVTTAAEKGGETREFKVPVTEPVYINVFPLMFYRDLRKAGDEISYQVYLESEEKVAPIKVRYIGETRVYIKSISVPARHYQVQMQPEREEYQDYYLNPKTGAILKLAFGKIEFLPAKN